MTRRPCQLPVRDPDLFLLLLQLPEFSLGTLGHLGADRLPLDIEFLAKGSEAVLA